MCMFVRCACRFPHKSVSCSVCVCVKYILYVHVTVCVWFGVALHIFILVVYRVVICQCQADMDMEKKGFLPVEGMYSRLDKGRHTEAWTNQCRSHIITGAGDGSVWLPSNLFQGCCRFGCPHCSPPSLLHRNTVSNLYVMESLWLHECDATPVLAYF